MQSECVGETVMKRQRSQRAQRCRQPRTAAGHELVSEAASVHTPWLPELHVASGRLRGMRPTAAGVIELHSFPRPTRGPPPVSWPTAAATSADVALASASACSQAARPLDV